MSFEARDYQIEAVQSVYDYFSQGKGDAPVICAPTGSGKSLVAALLMKRAVSEFPDTRILLATHVKELIVQDFQTLLRLWPNAPAGIYSAGLGSRQARARLLFAGVQSVYRRSADIGFVDLMIIDEAHLVGRNSESQYGQLISGLRQINPEMKLIGLSATPYRMDSGPLHSGPGAIFDGISYEIQIAMLVKRGYLCPLISKRPGTVFEVSGLHRRGGDFIESEMADRFGTDDITQAAVSEIVAAGQNRKSWLIFCINVDHALKVRDAVRSFGVSCETITGDTPANERDRAAADYKAGRIRCLTSVNVISTGFDAPNTDLLAMMRPTESTSLYLQQAGRGLRIAPEKQNCLVLDFAGNVARHGPVDAIAVASGRDKGPGQKGESAAPAKECPMCNSILWIGERECPDCGHLFPEPEPKIEREASTEAIMNMTAEDDWRPVRDFALSAHTKNGSVSMRVEYMIDLSGLKGVPFRVVSEFVCLEHTGFARKKAVTWWAQNAGTSPPATVAEALARQAEVRVPEEAVIRKEGEWWRIARLRGDARHMKLAAS